MHAATETRGAGGSRVERGGGSSGHDRCRSGGDDEGRIHFEAFG